MAKDPAFLFYPGDWLGGTTGMSLEEKGAYIELLVMQFNKGAFSIDQAKKLLNGSFETVWPALIDKFIEIEGKFFNVRLEEEKAKRCAFVSRQSQNGSKGGRKPKQNPWVNPNTPSGLSIIENENENVNKDDKNRVLEKKKDSNSEKSDSQKKPHSVPADAASIPELKTTFIQFPTNETFTYPLPELIAGSIIELVRISKYVDIDREQVEGLFRVFKTQHLTGGKFYQSEKEVFSHFINWSKHQNIQPKKNGTTQHSVGKTIVFDQL